MTSELRQLVCDISQTLGSPPPQLLSDDAPVLDESVLDDGRQQAMYLVGLIGGKDVGKSSLVNALVGREITAQTSYGPGTESVIAYAHISQESALKQLLDREAPGQYRIVTHAAPHLSRQVLLDLPDIDSHYAGHLELTRRMLRHMLYPVWLQSIEKYADQRPRELLAAVAAGNNPQNFVFCLNKADQLAKQNGDVATGELASDFAQRVAATLGLPTPPRVWIISAARPDQFELPELRRVLTQQKDEDEVDASRQLASQRQGESLVQWVREQHLDHRLAAAQRLRSAAEDEISARLTSPLLEQVLARLANDPVRRLSLADELMNRRVARWPIVNVLHILLSPLLFLVRRRLPLNQQHALAGCAEMVDVHLRSMSDNAAPALSQRIVAAFASLQQSFPPIARIYADSRPWEPMNAHYAEADLRQRLASTLERQNTVVRERFRSGGVLGAFYRLLLTLGAVIWFPFAQPLLETYLAGQRDWGALSRRFVSLLSTSALLNSAIFLAVYFTLLWLILKWATQRRVDKALARLDQAHPDPTLSLTAQTLDWSDSLLRPIHAQAEQLEVLVARAAEFDHLAMPAASAS